MCHADSLQHPSPLLQMLQQQLQQQEQLQHRLQPSPLSDAAPFGRSASDWFSSGGNSHSNNNRRSTSDSDRPGAPLPPVQAHPVTSAAASVQPQRLSGHSSLSSVSDSGPLTPTAPRPPSSRQPTAATPSSVNNPLFQLEEKISSAGLLAEDVGGDSGVSVDEDEDGGDVSDGEYTTEDEESGVEEGAGEPAGLAGLAAWLGAGLGEGEGEGGEGDWALGSENTDVELERTIMASVRQALQVGGVLGITLCTGLVPGSTLLRFLGVLFLEDSWGFVS